MACAASAGATHSAACAANAATKPSIKASEKRIPGQPRAVAPPAPFALACAQ